MEKREIIYRHSGAVRITHWLNALVLLVLLMSGLQIFNAHPALYLGPKSTFDAPVMAMAAVQEGDSAKGVTMVLGHSFDSTGVFGLATDSDGNLDERGFPWSVTLPGHRDLAMGRRWHFFFAWLFLFNGLVYLAWSLASGHLRRDLAPSGKELKHIGASIAEHARLKFPKGEEAKRYNVLQKLTYLFVALVLLPLMLHHRARHVARHGRGLPRLARNSRRQTDGAHHSFHRRERDRAVRRGASRHGADLGRLEQSPLDDHRPLRDRARGGEAMSRGHALDRRGFLARGLAAASTMLLGGCEDLSDQPWVRRVLDSAETLTRVTQRALLTPQALAREYSEADLSKEFKANGSTDPQEADYLAHVKNGFADWTLAIGGLVEQPLSLSLEELRAMPSRTQITRHDCVEGWSCIGKWKGVPLSALLEKARAQSRTRATSCSIAPTICSTPARRRTDITSRSRSWTRSTRKPSSLTR